MKTTECQCSRCIEDFRDWADNRNQPELLIASDPERDPAHRYADDVEWRDRMNDLAPIVSYYPRTPHPEWGGIVLTENYMRMISSFAIATSEV